MLARVRLSEQRSRQVIDKIKKQFLEEVIQIIRTTLASLHAPGDTSESTHFLAERTSCLLQGDSWEVPYWHRCRWLSCATSS